MMCTKTGCDKKADVILSLPLFGNMLFCAKCALLNTQWEIAIQLKEKSNDILFTRAF